MTTGRAAALLRRSGPKGRIMAKPMIMSGAGAPRPQR
jgi:hypothetical protein